MKMPNPQIVSVSVFCNANYRQKFMAECLKPYILMQKQNQKITEAFIAFNYHQGSNIRVALDFAIEESENSVNELQALFSTYLKNNPSEPGDSNFIGNSLFMDFPNNSCQLDQFSISFNKHSVRLQLVLSRKILEIFSVSVCDDSSVFTFLLHVIIAFSKQWGDLYKTDTHSEITQTLFEKCNAPSVSYLDEIFQPYHELFQDNRAMFMEIYEDVVSAPSIENSWFDIKAAYLQYLQISPTVSELNTVLMPFDLAIANQLSLNDQSLLSIYYLIHLIYSTQKFADYEHTIQNSI